MGFAEHFELYRNVVEWIREHVEDSYHNTSWIKQGDVIRVQFRKEQDLLMFTLKFGSSND